MYETVSDEVVTYPNGALTQHLSKMDVGDKIGVRGPKGAFTYTPNMAKEICMVAGGTGITPMLQIIRAILRNPQDQTKIRLIFGNVTKDDILLEKELSDLVQKHGDQFTVYHVLNEPPSGWAHGIGFITQEMLEEKFPKPAGDIKVLVCGPPPLVKAITNATTSLGFEAPRTVSKLTDQVFKF
ncbi:ferredoxin reductase-like protein [Backusella circina FSU 941]|nr:ferredoxin reductase-like protein [Backusella circina FSU 941]